MPQVHLNGRSLYIGRHGNRDRYSVDPGAVTQDVVVYIRYKRSPWCLKGGKVTVTVTQSLVCPRIRQRENRGMQRHPASKSGPTTGSTAARLGKTRTARKIRILRGYGKYDMHIRHRGQRLNVLCMLLLVRFHIHEGVHQSNHVTGKSSSAAVRAPVQQ